MASVGKGDGRGHGESNPIEWSHHLIDNLEVKDSRGSAGGSSTHPHASC